MKTKTGILIMSFLAVLISACSSDEKTIGLKESIQHDDFRYSVESFERTKMIVETKAGGMFYIVKFRVQNDAKRVDHEWKNDIAYVIDEKGKQYENNIGLQKQIEAVTPFGYKDKYVTHAGVSETTVLVFELPADVKEPYLKVRGDFLMGDLFDGNQFKNTKVKLF